MLFFKIFILWDLHFYEVNTFKKSTANSVTNNRTAREREYGTYSPKKNYNLKIMADCQLDILRENELWELEIFKRAANKTK